MPDEHKCKLILARRKKNRAAAQSNRPGEIEAAWNYSALRVPVKLRG
jgi:hypothetical protein